MAGEATLVATQEAAARYKGMFPKRAGKPELGDVRETVRRMASGPLLKNEASLHAYSCVASQVAAVAGAGHIGDVPLTASEPTHDPKAGVRQ